MNFVKTTCIAFGAALLLASCGESNQQQGLTQFDACNCATVEDMNSADYAKCKELRTDATFEADYQRCKLAIKSGISDTSKVTIQNADNATNLQAAGDGNYTLDVTTSSLTWRGENVVGKKHQGTILVKRGSVNISGGEIKGGEIVIDMNTLTNTDLSGNEKAKIESHLKSADFFDSAKYGEAVYTIVSGTKKNAINYNIVGKLTIKGITHDLNCTLVIAPNGDGINVGGGFVFDRSEFDVKFGSDKFFDNLGDNLIKDEVIMTVNLQGKKQ
jgi:polyisoprenoid-binding protein YceI